MSAKLCEMKTVLKRELDQYIKYVRRPKYICKSCGRVSNLKKLICKPAKIKE